MKKKLKRIKQIVKNYDNKIAQICFRNKFMSNMYYFIKPSFWREEKAVLHGKYQYMMNSKNNKTNLFFLRRSIHRLEKGIIMRPRREIFAESYIEDTVDTFMKLQIGSDNSSTLEWANDVLTNYFQVVNINKSPQIKFASKRFLDSNYTKKKESSMIPFNRNNQERPSINIDEFEKLAIFRRSVRWFEDLKIDHSLIDKAIGIAGYSPSACNRVPYKFRVFDDKKKVNEIAGSAMGTSGYLDNIPTLVAVVGDLSAYIDERDRHLIYIDSSLAAMSFVYALELQGVGSCIINWPDIEKRERKIANLLNLKPYERVTMLIAIGYEDKEGMVAYSKKKDINEMRSYNI